MAIKLILHACLSLCSPLPQLLDLPLVLLIIIIAIIIHIHAYMLN